MAHIRYAPRAWTALDRLSEFLLEADPRAALETVELIISAVDALADHPLLGRVVESDYGELVISRGKTGYLALYRYDEAVDEVLILAVRHQREAGYS